ncbi:MAG: M20/M25/M40 family metallo-hydrolase, partial [Pseudomonadota bacterium]
HGNNFIVTVPGTDQSSNDVLEVVAHYDTENRSVSGADDNGTGLAVSLELLRLLQKYPPKKSVRFVFSDLEEVDGSGAEHHLETIEDRDEDFIGALVIDMFGYSKLETSPRVTVEVGTRSDHESEESYQATLRLAEAFVDQAAQYKGRVAGLDVETWASASETGDHGAYWDADFPAIFIAQPTQGFNPANHSEADKIENMNWGFFLSVAELIVETVASISGAEISETDQVILDRENRLKVLDRSPVDLTQMQSRPKPTGSQSSSSSTGGTTNYSSVSDIKEIDLDNLDFPTRARIFNSIRFRDLRKYAVAAMGLKDNHTVVNEALEESKLDEIDQKASEELDQLNDPSSSRYKFLRDVLSDIDHWRGKIKS